MKIVVIFACLICCITTKIFAQNWQGVSAVDTVYYTVAHEVQQGSIDSNYLRVIYTDSVSVNTNVTLFHFWRGIRAANVFQACIDTLAPSWLGYNCLRYDDGREYYINSYGDSILFYTHGNINDSWTIAKDTNGVALTGTISQITTTVIDSSLDSIKVISLQAYSNGQPVSNPYNGMQLQLSKNHGWIQILDLYGFPNNIWKAYDLTVKTLPGLHIRLDKRFKEQYRSFVNPAKKYATGNEWIIKNIETPLLGGSLPVITLEYDSVISYTISSADSVTYIAYKKSATYNPNIGNNYFSGYDTAKVYIEHAQDKIYTTLLPEVKVTSMQDYSQVLLSKQNFYSYFLAKKYCNDQYLIQERGWSDKEGLNQNLNCWVLIPTVSEFHTKSYDYYNEFGNVYDSSSDGYVASTSQYLYLKTSDCTIGTKFEILAVKDILNNSGVLELYPNPTSSVVTITLNQSLKKSTITLYDALGRMIYSDQFTGQLKLNTSNFSKGVYAVVVKNSNTIWIKKLVIE